MSYYTIYSAFTFASVMAEQFDTRWFKSAPTPGNFTSDQIDVENGIIRDVVMVQEGPAKGHGVSVEASFIDDIVAYDIKHFSQTGLKARFGHPSASNETMGTQLGIFTDFRKRVVNGKAEEIANLQLLSAADDSPTHPGMRTWVLKMAQERPDFLMSSIVFSGKSEYQRTPDGAKHQLRRNEDGSTNKKSEYGPVFIEFGEHYFTDIVEQGAATESLFSNQVNLHLFVAKADQFLEDHPEITAFIKSHPEKVSAFFASMGINIQQQPSKKMAFDLFKWLSGSDDQEATPDLEPLRAALSAAKDEVTALQAAKEAAENRVEEFEAENMSLSESLARSVLDIKALSAQLESLGKELESLKAEAADNHTGGDTDQGGKKSTTPVWDKFKQQYGL